MIIVDIGANIGEFSKHTLENCPDAIVYAVEPNKPLCATSLNQLKDIYGDRFDVGYFALGAYTGKAKLFGSNFMNGQLSSLLDFNESSAGWVQHQSHLEGNSEENSLEVDVFTSAEFAKARKIEKIDFLKIDTQGTDLQILEALLDCNEVVSGVVEVEVGFSSNQSRYKDSLNDVNELIKILSSRKLIITKILPNNSSCDEINVFFGKDIEIFELINNELALSSNPIFAKYWKIYGVGLTKSETDVVLVLKLMNKVMKSLSHPIQSFRSILIKLTK